MPPPIARNAASMYSSMTAITSVWGCDWLSQRLVSMRSVWQRGGGSGRQRHRNLVGSSELAAGGVDRSTAVLAHRRVDAQIHQALTDLPHARRRGATSGVSGRRVQGDEVDMGAEAPGNGGELPG